MALSLFILIARLWHAPDQEHTDMLEHTLQLLTCQHDRQTGVGLKLLISLLWLRCCSGYCSSQSTLAELAKRTVDPENTTPITRNPPKPPVPLPNVSVAGSCNKYIPGGRTMDRFLWTVQWLIANGMYVLIDYHPMVSAYLAQRVIHGSAYPQPWAIIHAVRDTSKHQVFKPLTIAAFWYQPEWVRPGAVLPSQMTPLP